MGDRVYFVETNSRLRLRQAPNETAPILARLDPGQVVARLDEEDREGWCWVFADVPGDGAFVGYVAREYLSPRRLSETPQPTPKPAPATAPAAEVSPFAKELVACCVEEWRFFKNGTLKEGNEPARARIGEYWRALGYDDRDGNSKFAWSAAFIFYMMKKAGAGDRFRYSAARCDYMNKAIREKDEVQAGFRACRPEVYVPQVGDIIARDRPGEGMPQKVTFDRARKIGFYTSHTDIVVEIAPREIVTIGGNLGHSVKREVLATDASGCIDSQTVKKRMIFAVLRNNLTDPV